jgi:hypothetical protein
MKPPFISANMVLAGPGRIGRGLIGLLLYYLIRSFGLKE